jgi:glycosyltransferase involved in cell wall biosynthesis
MSVQPKISIVVPIYGVEKYLNECVDSILNQTLRDIEVVLVDDGSKDRCPEMVDEYAARDSRVVAIHQPNGGYGRAVNHGIEVATGEYIGIIESDDWIEPTMYEKLYASAKQHNTDITKGEFYAYDSQASDGQCDKLWKSRYQDLDDAPDGVFSIADYPLFLAFHASIWSSIYRADFIKPQKVSETRSASYQDFPFMVEAICRAKRISVVKEPLVHYRMEENQNSSTIRRDERLILMPVQCAEGKRILKEYGKYELLKEEFYFHSFLACIGFYHTIYPHLRKKYFQEFHVLLQETTNDRKFTWKYFSEEQKREAMLIAQASYLQSRLTIWHQSFTRHKRSFVSMRIRKDGVRINLLGIKLRTGKYKTK